MNGQVTCLATITDLTGEFGSCTRCLCLGHGKLNFCRAASAILNLMKAFISLFSIVLAIYCAGASRVQMEFESPLYVPSGWQQLRQPEPWSIIRLTFAVRQQNVDKLESLFWAVSTPGSGAYGHYLTRDQISQLIAPDLNHIRAVREFLQQSNATITETHGGEFIIADMMVREAEQLLQCVFHEYHHVSSGVRLRRTSHYSLPQEVANAVDFVGGTVRYVVGWLSCPC